MERFSILSIIESVTNIFIALILVIYLNLGIKGFFLGQTLGSLLVFSFSVFTVLIMDIHHLI